MLAFRWERTHIFSSSANLFLRSCVGAISRALPRRLPLNTQRLQQALRIQAQSYQLLLWLSENPSEINRPNGKHRAGGHRDGPTATRQWLQKNLIRLPADFRPAETELHEFAAFFSTYLTSSFDVENPHGLQVSTANFCDCEICVRLRSIANLKAKKVGTREKKRANYLMENCVMDLAKANGLELSLFLAEDLVRADVTRRSAAYVTYGHWLVERLKGETDGPGVLALWRILSRSSKGGSRRGFKLRLEHFEAAEESLLEAIRRFTAG